MVVKRKLVFPSSAMKKRKPNGSLIPLTAPRNFSYAMSTKTFVLPAPPTIYSTTVTTGLISNSYAVNATNISGWSTRFSSTFDEYRVVKAVFEIVPLGLNPGATMFYISDTSLAANTITEAEERGGMLVKNNEQAPVNRTVFWLNKDFTDASWRSVATSYNDAYLYIYTDNANYASPATVTPLFIIRGKFTVQFRGLAST